MMRFLYEGLVISHLETLEPLPGVAERWEISEDGRTYTFHLREEARWSDGSQLTASDLRQRSLVGGSGSLISTTRSIQRNAISSPRLTSV